MTMEEDMNVDKTTLSPVKECTYLGTIIASHGHRATKENINGQYIIRAPSRKTQE